MHHVAAKFVPSLLTDEQKGNCVTVSQELFDWPNADDNFLKNVKTGDETWVYGYVVKMKRHLPQWVGELSHDQKKKTHQSHSHVKVMLIVFFDWKGIVHHEFVPCGQTVSKEFYLKFLKHLREAVWRKRPEAWTNKTWRLHHDNAPFHEVLLTWLFGKARDGCHPPSTLQIYVDFPSPPLHSWNPHWKIADFWQQKREKENFCKICAPSRKTCSKMHSEQKNVGSGVSTVKETSLIKL